VLVVSPSDMRQLVGRPPVSDLFGVKGREWLAVLGAGA
jgi:hypothetical protein